MRNLNQKISSLAQKFLADKVIIHTDGACRGNPGPGGWGALLQFGEHEKTMRGASKMTTNNRMELEAAIKALSVLRRPCRVVLYTDSQYLKNGVLHWMDKWKTTNWRTSDRKPVKNREQWEAIDALRERHKITWRWIKGHSGNAGNEIADSLANRAMNEL